MSTEYLTTVNTELLKRTFRSSPVILFGDGAEALRLASGDGHPNKVQVLREGKFYHRNKEGEVEEIVVTRELMDSMIKNFSEKVRGIDLAIDFAHESGKEAAAWITNLFVEDTDAGAQLWAEVQWTGAGKSKIQEREYRYLSADFTLNHVDNETLQEYGPVLFGAGLTNRPVVKNMSPVIELSEKNYSEAIQNQEMEGDGKMEEKVKELEAMVAALREEVAGLKAEKESLMGDKKAAEDKLGGMEKELAESKKAIELSEKEKKFSVLLSEGKAVEAQREAFIEGDMVKFTELAQPLNLKAQGSGKDNETKKFADAEAELDSLVEKKLSEDKGLKVSEARRLVLSENAELNKRLSEKKSA